MLVYLDSSVLCQDFYMKKTSFDLLKRKNKIILSEVVLDEVMNKYKRTIEERIKIANKAIKRLNGITASSVPLVDETEIVVADELKKYSDFLNGAVTVERYPEIEHKDIVNRALQRQKPFTQDGKEGYRDYLIWRTFLNIAKFYETEIVCFITSNTHDFSDTDDKKKLHNDLFKELEDMGISKDRIQYWISIKDFVAYNTIECKLEEGIVASIISDQESFYNQLDDILESEMMDVHLWEYNSCMIGEATLNSVECVLRSDIEEISEISETECLLKVVADIIGVAHSFIFKAELVAMDEEELKAVVIIDPDWNRHYVLAEIKIALKIKIEIIYERIEQEIKSFEIIDIVDEEYSELTKILSE